MRFRTLITGARGVRALGRCHSQKNKRRTLLQADMMTSLGPLQPRESLRLVALLRLAAPERDKDKVRCSLTGLLQVQKM